MLAPIAAEYQVCGNSEAFVISIYNIDALSKRIVRKVILEAPKPDSI